MRYVKSTYFLFLRSPIVLLASAFGRFEPLPNCCIGEFVLEALIVPTGGKGAEVDTGAETGTDVA